MDHGPVTVKEIASRTGLSLRTVCRVLGSQGEGHKVETRRRVMAAAEALGYIPNANAKAIRSGRFNAIALLLSSDSSRSHLPAGLLEGIQSELNSHDLHLMVASLSDAHLTNDLFVPKFLRQYMADGMLVNYTLECPPALEKLIREHRVPSVWINRRLEADCVYPDDFNAAWRATESLLRLGHKRVAYVDYHNDFTGSAPHYSVTDRMRGYEQAMTASGLAPRIVRANLKLSPAERISAAAQLLNSADRPTAAVCYSPWTATPVWLGATLKCGLEVPRDLSLVTFSDVMYNNLGIAISSMILPEPQIGKAAVEMLRMKIQESDRPQAPRCLASVFEEGATMAPPPNHL